MLTAELPAADRDRLLNHMTVGVTPRKPPNSTPGKWQRQNTLDITWLLCRLSK
jgi:hypothetical protein